MKKIMRLMILLLVFLLLAIPALGEGEQPAEPISVEDTEREMEAEYSDRDVLFIQQDGDVAVDLLLKCMQSEYVESFSLFGMDGARSDSLKPIGYQEGMAKFMQPSVKNPDEEVEAPHFTLYCQSDLDEQSFGELAGNVVEGALLDADGSGQCMISRALAEQNGKKVGDTISLFNYQNPERKLELVVCGIYESVFALNSENLLEDEASEGALDDGAAQDGESVDFETALADNSNNDIYVQLEDMLAFTQDNGVEYTWNLSECSLKDAANLEAFAQECRQNGLPDGVEVVRMADLFEVESDAGVWDGEFEEDGGEDFADEDFEEASDEE